MSTTADANVQLIRNATILVDVGDTTFLVDPIFASPGENPPVPNSPNDRPNPLVPMPAADLSYDAVVVTHRHPDHWDEAAIKEFEASRQTAERVFSKATDYAVEHDITLETAIESGHPAKRISAYADANDITRIVIGTREQSLLSRILLGSLPDGIMKRSSVPVTTIQTPTDEASRKPDGADQDRPLTLSRGIN